MERAESGANDFGLLLLRLAVGGLMLFHGISKIQNGIGWMEEMLANEGLPREMAYGSYVGEVAAPILILIGFLTRPAALLVAFTMVTAVYLVLRDQVLALNQTGGWAIELNAFFFLAALALVFTGPGRYSFSGGNRWWG